MLNREFFSSSEESFREEISDESYDSRGFFHQHSDPPIDQPLESQGLQHSTNSENTTLLGLEKLTPNLSSKYLPAVCRNQNMLVPALSGITWLSNQTHLTEESKLEEITLEDHYPDGQKQHSGVFSNNFIESGLGQILAPEATSRGPAVSPESPYPDYSFILSILSEIIEYSLHRATNSSSSRRRTKPCPIPAMRTYLSCKLGNLAAFFTSPLPQGLHCQCTVKRDSSGLSNRLWRKYYLFLSDGWVFLLASRKRKWSKTANYMITARHSDFDVKGEGYIGKLRGNFKGSEYSVYSPGLNPRAKGATQSNTRQEYAGVLYVASI